VRGFRFSVAFGVFFPRTAGILLVPMREGPAVFSIFDIEQIAGATKFSPNREDDYDFC
jgi:hypothetical protein